MCPSGTAALKAGRWDRCAAVAREQCILELLLANRELLQVQRGVVDVDLEADVHCSLETGIEIVYDLEREDRIRTSIGHHLMIQDQGRAMKAMHPGVRITFLTASGPVCNGHPW